MRNILFEFNRNKILHEFSKISLDKLVIGFKKLTKYLYRNILFYILLLTEIRRNEIENFVTFSL